MLTNSLTYLLLDFCKSKESSISDFFVSFLDSKFGKNRRLRNRYCITFILSLLRYKPKYDYLKLYYELLTKYDDKEVLAFFFNCRNLCLSMHNLIEFGYINLDLVFLNDEEWIFVLNNSLGYDLTQIKKFKDEFVKKVRKLAKTNGEYITKYIKSSEYNLSYFLSQLVYKFLDITKNENKKKQEELNKFMGRLSTNDLNKVPKRETALKDRVSKLEMISEDPFDMNNEEKLKEKERILKEIKECVKMTNRYKNSCVKLMSYIHEIDPIFKEIKTELNSNSEVLKKLKEKELSGEKYEEFTKKASMGAVNFIHEGSKLFDKNSAALKKTLIKTNTKYYKILSERSKDYIPTVKVLIRSLRDKIFNDNFNLLNNENIKNKKNLNNELQKIFGNFKLKNKDYVLLNTVFNNYDSNNQKDLSLDNVLNKISSNIITTVNKILGLEDDDDNYEDTIRENYQTEQKKHNDIKKMDNNAYLQVLIDKKNENMREEYENQVGINIKNLEENQIEENVEEVEKEPENLEEAINEEEVVEEKQTLKVKDDEAQFISFQEGKNFQSEIVDDGNKLESNKKIEIENNEEIESEVEEKKVESVKEVENVESEVVEEIVSVVEEEKVESVKKIQKVESEADEEIESVVEEEKVESVKEIQKVESEKQLKIESEVEEDNNEELESDIEEHKKEEVDNKSVSDMNQECEVMDSMNEEPSEEEVNNEAFVENDAKRNVSIPERMTFKSEFLDDKINLIQEMDNQKKLSEIENKKIIEETITENENEEFVSDAKLEEDHNEEIESEIEEAQNEEIESEIAEERVESVKKVEKIKSQKELENVGSVKKEEKLESEKQIEEIESEIEEDKKIEEIESEVEEDKKIEEIESEVEENKKIEEIESEVEEDKKIEEIESEVEKDIKNEEIEEDKKKEIESEAEEGSGLKPQESKLVLKETITINDDEVTETKETSKKNTMKLQHIDFDSHSTGKNDNLNKTEDSTLEFEKQESIVQNIEQELVQRESEVFEPIQRESYNLANLIRETGLVQDIKIEDNNEIKLNDQHNEQLSHQFIKK